MEGGIGGGQRNHQVSCHITEHRSRENKRVMRQRAQVPAQTLRQLLRVGTSRALHPPLAAAGPGCLLAAGGGTASSAAAALLLLLPRPLGGQAGRLMLLPCIGEGGSRRLPEGG